MNPKLFEWRDNSFFPLFFNLGRMRFMFMCLLSYYIAPTTLLVPKPFGARWQLWWTAASVGGQLHGDTECPFSGGTNSGSPCRKVLDAGSVGSPPYSWTVGREVWRFAPRVGLRPCCVCMHTAAVIVIAAAVRCKCALWSSGYAAPVHVHVVWQRNKILSS